MNKEQITIIAITTVSVIAIIAVLLSQPKPEPKPEIDLGGMAKILEAVKPAPQPAPNFVNRVNSDDIKDSQEAKRQGDTKPCCEADLSGDGKTDYYIK